VRAGVPRLVVSGALAAWGGVLVVFCAGGRIDSYLHPAFHPWALAAGIVLLLLAAGVALLRGTGRPLIASGWPGLLVVTVPMLASAAVSGSGFGATAVMNRGIVNDIGQLPAFTPLFDPPLPGEENVGEGTMMDPALYLQKNAEGDILAETVDLLYAASDEWMREDFEDQRVEVVGQLLPARTRNPDGDRFHLVRMFVMCCAADARPVGIDVKAPAGTDFPEMAWVRVRGRAVFPVENGRHTALVLADSVEPAEAPGNSFLY
jgi:uncharacterized repeat protein (TIGR03943 family)